MILHHLGIVVDHLDEAIPLFEAWMGARRIGGVVEEANQLARIQLMAIAPDTLLELLEPLPGGETMIYGPGEMHLCFTVPDLDAEMRRLHDLGALVTRPATTAGLFDNRRLGFMATSSGQLLELLEDPTVPVS